MSIESLELRAKKLQEKIETQKLENKEKTDRLMQLQKAQYNLEQKIEASIYDGVYEKQVTTQNNDSGGFNVGEYSFYYGYEYLVSHPLLKYKVTRNEDIEDITTWAFIVKKNNKEIFRKGILPEHINWDINAGLLVGMAYWIESRSSKKK